MKVIAQGTGQALDTARRGDADVVFVHAKAQEEKFVADGFGVKRFDVMYNDFVLIGPKSDPAGVKGKDIETALKAIQAKAAPFVSRGDKSGTHSAELALWKVAGVDIAAAKGPWYREIGQGMGPALNTAGAMNGYVLSDRGTWISFKNRGDLEIAVEGDKRLFNQYGVMLVNPEKFPEREEGIRPGLCRLAGVRRKARPRSPPTRSTASSCSSPMRIKRRPENGRARVYFLVSGGQSGRTGIGFPSLCTVGAAELACPPAEGRIALFSIAIELAVLPVVWSLPAAADGVQFVSGLLLAGAEVCASAGVAASRAATTMKRACIFGSRAGRFLRTSNFFDSQSATSRRHDSSFVLLLTACVMGHHRA